MYLRTVVTINKKGQTYRYLRLVEGYRVGNKVKQRVIHNFGNVAKLDPDKIDRIIQTLSKFSHFKVIPPHGLESENTLMYGNVLVAKHFWEKLNLPQIIADCGGNSKKSASNRNLTTLVMVINRLIAPKSKLAVTEWQDKIYLPELEEVRPKYQHYLRTLNYLYRIKDKLEKALFDQLVNLFNLELNLVFYDITSSYFEGTQCSLAEFGYSRDHREDKKQILLGLIVTQEGLPIAHEVFVGNRTDKTTLKEAIIRLQTKFNIKKTIFVCDRGMISAENILAIEQAGYNYIIALKKRRSHEVKDILSVASTQEYTVLSAQLWLKEVTRDNIRYLICYNPQKAKDDEQYRKQIIQRIKVKLENLVQQVKSGQLKERQRILIRATEILASVKGSKKYFLVHCPRDGNFSYQLREKVIADEQTMDGIYIIKTNYLSLSGKEIVMAYKNLYQVEDAFREIKDFLEIRPIYLREESRVRAHVLICVLAYIIEKIIDNRLVPLGISARVALEKLEEIRLVNYRIGNTTIKSITTKPVKEQKEILYALGIDLIS